MKKVPISLLCGVSSILITVLLYIVIFNDANMQTIHILTLGGIVCAEIITTIYAFLAKGNPRKVAATVVSAFNVPISAILSVIFIASFPTGYLTYVCLYLAVLIATNTISLILSR